MLHHQTHVKALELTGRRRRLTSLLYRALMRRGSVTRSCSRPRTAGHAATLSESRKTSAFLNREANIHELLRMNNVAPWERNFQFRPFAVDVFGVYEDGAAAILQQVARRRSMHTSMTVCACKWLPCQSLSVALQTAKARILRSKKALVAPLSLLPLLPGVAS
jgi:hypothetical protein